MKARFEEEAREELESASDWYEEQSPGLGLRFVSEMETLADLAARFPRMFPQVEPGVRRALNRDFEFHLYYCVETDHIRIVSVVHAQRDPGAWRKGKS